ncbi:MAG: M15 family metallopeptidase [Dysgonomonas sp.]
MKRILLFFTVFLFVVSCNEQNNKQLAKNEVLADSVSVAYQQKDIQQKTTLETYLDSIGLVCVTEEDSTILIELKYATTDNFTGNILYEDLNTAYLHPFAMDKLKKAQRMLQEKNPQYSLLVYDAARPLSVQAKMYESVKDTKYRAYVANPSRTGLHNYGMAVDLTIYDKSANQPLDMGSEFDHFGKLAGINNEDLFLSQGLLSKVQVENRRLLRSVMKQAGFYPIRGEWWHFNASTLSEAGKMAELIR